MRPSSGQAVYAATKGGILAFTKALAVECGQSGVRVNCVSPGPVRTEMLEAAMGVDVEAMLARTPLRVTFATADEIAASVAFTAERCSVTATFTGADLSVDGGYAAGFP